VLYLNAGQKIGVEAETPTLFSFEPVTFLLPTTLFGYKMEMLDIGLKLSCSETNFP
jgi:hypothetical protein